MIVPEQNHEIWNDAREASHGRSISLSDADCKTCCSSCGQKLLANYLEQLIIQMSSVVTGITIQMGPHMWTLRWLVDARFLSLVSSGHTFTQWQLFFFGDKWSCKTSHHVHHDHHGQGYFLLAETSFSGTSMLKTSVVVCAKGKGGCLDHLGSLLSASPALQGSLVGKQLEKWTRTSDNTKNLGVWR